MSIENFDGEIDSKLNLVISDEAGALARRVAIPTFAVLSTAKACAIFQKWQQCEGRENTEPLVGWMVRDALGIDIAGGKAINNRKIYLARLQGLAKTVGLVFVFPTHRDLRIYHQRQEALDADPNELFYSGRSLEDY